MAKEAEIFIGIDVSKTWLDVAIHEEKKVVRVRNNDEKIPGLVKLMLELEPTLIVLEATGGYEKKVVRYLAKAGLSVVVTNPRRVRAFARSTGQLAKTDKLDAKVLAHFGCAVRPVPRELPTEEEELLTSMLKRRKQIVDMLTVERNRLHTAQKMMQEDIEEHIAWLEEKLCELNATIAEKMNSNSEWKRKDEILQSAQGVGTITSSTMLAMMPELGKVTGKEIAALAGVAPVNKDSGKKQRKRRVYGGRATVRSVLYMATLSAIKYNPVIKEFYERLIKKGKEKKVAITACMRKLLVILNAMVRDDRTWQAKPA